MTAKEKALVASLRAELREIGGALVDCFEHQPIADSHNADSCWVCIGRRLQKRARRKA